MNSANLGFPTFLLYTRGAEFAAPIFDLLIHVPPYEYHDDGHQTSYEPIPQGSEGATPDAPSEHTALHQPCVEVGGNELLPTLQGFDALQSNGFWPLRRVSFLEQLGDAGLDPIFGVKSFTLD